VEQCGASMTPQQHWSPHQDSRFGFDARRDIASIENMSVNCCRVCRSYVLNAVECFFGARLASQFPQQSAIFHRLVLPYIYVISAKRVNSIQPDRFAARKQIHGILRVNSCTAISLPKELSIFAEVVAKHFRLIGTANSTLSA
jgi:hypothetical protein